MAKTQYLSKDIEKRKNQLRHLRPFKKLMETDPEKAEDFLDRVAENKTVNFLYEKRIKDKIKEFEKDYDLSSLKANDMMQLRALIQSIINLEDYEQAYYKIQKKIFDGVDTQDDLLKLEKLSKIMDTLRVSISRFQEDLKISRRIRQSDEESNLVDYISKLKNKAKNFYESRHVRIFCPECNTLIFTGWFLYPSSFKNYINVFCDRCKKDYKFKIKDIYENGMTNYKDIPEF